MFNKTLMSSNQFTALNKSTQLLYMYLNLQADDDGIGSPSALREQQMTGHAAVYLGVEGHAALDEIRLLLLPFDADIEIALLRHIADEVAEAFDDGGLPCAVIGGGIECKLHVTFAQDALVTDVGLECIHDFTSF